MRHAPPTGRKQASPVGVPVPCRRRGRLQIGSWLPIPPRSRVHPSVQYPENRHARYRQRRLNSDCQSQCPPVRPPIAVRQSARYPLAGTGLAGVSGGFAGGLHGFSHARETPAPRCLPRPPGRICGYGGWREAVRPFDNRLFFGGGRRCLVGQFGRQISHAPKVACWSRPHCYSTVQQWNSTSTDSRDSRRSSACSRSLRVVNRITNWRTSPTTSSGTLPSVRSRISLRCLKLPANACSTHLRASSLRRRLLPKSARSSAVMLWPAGRPLGFPDCPVW